MKIFTIFALLLVAMTIVGCAQSETTVSQGSGNTETPSETQSAQSEQAIDDALVTEEDDVELGELL
jgi:hypothetical protein